MEKGARAGAKAGKRKRPRGKRPAAWAAQISRGRDVLVAAGWLRAVHALHSTSAI